MRVRVNEIIANLLFIKIPSLVLLPFDGEEDKYVGFVVLIVGVFSPRGGDGCELLGECLFVVAGADEVLGAELVNFLRTFLGLENDNVNNEMKITI